MLIGTPEIDGVIDDAYIKSDAHPSVNDAVELRIGSVKDDVFPAYTSNPDHHLFMMDAYGKRVSCFKDSMTGYLGAAKIASDKKSYVVEIAIPILRALTTDDVINMNFQIDDLQTDKKCGYIGAAEAYNKLVSFKVSAEDTYVDEAVETEAAAASEKTAVTAAKTVDPVTAVLIAVMAIGSAVTVTVTATKKKNKYSPAAPAAYISRY